jgi:nitrite reductase/ring-hydroxylating ferredoxin subunit/Fe-S cluster biogenesis protein NfuA
MAEQTVQNPRQNMDSATEFERLAGDIDKLDSIIAGWGESYQLTTLALKSSIEALHKEAMQRLIRALKDDPAAGAKLREALNDQVVFGVLNYHGLLRQPLNARVEAALAEVRPFMQSHGGNVELVAIKRSEGSDGADTVEIRLIGSCHGCPASSQTLTEGVEKAIRKHCPEIININQVSRGASEAAANGQQLYFISPFASDAASGWLEACQLADIPTGNVLERTVKGRSVLLYREGDEVSCVDNSCAHLGMPLEMGEVTDGVITCTYHGFRYLLASGECLTVPEVQLKVHAVRVKGGSVEVRLEE